MMCSRGSIVLPCLLLLCIVPSFGTPGKLVRLLSGAVYERRAKYAPTCVWMSVSVPPRLCRGVDGLGLYASRHATQAGFAFFGHAGGDAGGRHDRRTRRAFPVLILNSTRCDVVFSSQCRLFSSLVSLPGKPRVCRGATVCSTARRCGCERKTNNCVLWEWARAGGIFTAWVWLREAHLDYGI